jgi:hypothetical protein
MECAPGWQITGEGWITGQPGGGISGRRVTDPRECGSKCAGVGMFWIIEDLKRWARLDDLPRVHNSNAVTGGAEHSKVMTDENHAHATSWPGTEIAYESGQQIKYLGLHHDIEGSSGLIGDDEGRLTG